MVTPSCCTRGRASGQRRLVISPRAAGVVIGDLASAAETDAVVAQMNRLGRMDAVIHNARYYAVRDPRFQDKLVATLAGITGIELR
jgi:hypothetical protein